MQNISITPLKLADYIFNDDPALLHGNELISQIYNKFLHEGKAVSNKDIIFILIRSIETEEDIALQNTYLEALEYIVYRTPDDWGQ